MPEKENSLIAYNDLKRLIIEPGFCTLCGACEAACPVHALRVKEDRLEYTHDCSQYMDFCPICYDVCPHSEPLLLESFGFVTGAPNRRESLGYYRRVLLARAADPVLRKLSHGGGVVTTILTNSIQKGIIDSAVVSRKEKNVTLGLEPSIVLVPDDVLSAVDAEFFPSAVAKAFGNAVHEYGKTTIAFVGTPCQVLALRKLESWQHKIVGSLKVVIGMMCLWSFSLGHLLQGIEADKGIKPGDIERITLDGEYSLYMKDRIEPMSINDARKYILKGCITCSDYSAQLADISVGSAYPIEEWSVVIIRTKTGEELFDSALDNGRIETKELEEEPDVFAHITEMANLKRNVALEEIDKIRAANMPTPPKLSLLQPPNLKSPPKEISILSSLSVLQVMTSGAMTISPDTTTEQLLNIMTKYHHMGYPIVDENGELVGIVTFEDIMKIPQMDRSKVRVSSIRHEKLFTVYPDDTALDAYKAIIEHGIGRVLVVDRKDPKKLLGIITRTDIMHVLSWPKPK